MLKLKEQGQVICEAVFVAALALTGTTQVAFAEQTNSKDPITLRIGNANQPDQLQNLIDVKFADILKKLSGGRITTQVINGAQLGDEKELIQNVSEGTLDFATISVWNASGYVPKLDLFSGFFLFKDWNNFREVTQNPIVLDKVRDIVRKRKVGFQFLNWGTTGTFNMYGDRAFTSLQALKGVKMRIPDSRLQEKTWKALGMTTVIVPFSEEYTAMQSHVADASQHSLSSILSSKFYEVGPYITLTRALYNETATFESDRTIRKLSPADQKLVQKAIDEASVWSIGEAIKQEGSLIVKLRTEPHVKVIEKIKDLALWRAQVEPVNREYAKKIGAEGLLDAILDK